MKKIYLLAFAAVLLVLPAQTAMSKDFFSFGIKAGLNFTNMSGLSDFKQEGFMKTYTGFNVGAAFNFNLPLGFEIQPELLYFQSGNKVQSQSDIGGLVSLSGTETLRSGSLRIPVNVIWGIDLFGVVKPYLFVSPYVGFGLFANNIFVGSVNNTTQTIKNNLNDQLNVMQYGIGVGLGLKVWKFQLSFKWNWDLNPAFKVKEGVNFGEMIGDATKDMKFNGGELSLVFLF